MGGGLHPLFCPPGYAQTGKGHTTERGSQERGCAGMGSPPFAPPSPSRTRQRRARATPNPRSGAVGPPPPPVCAQGRHANKQPRGNGNRCAPGCTQKGHANWGLHANPRPPAWVFVQRRCAKRWPVQGQQCLSRLCNKETSKGQTWRHHPPSALRAGQHATRDARKLGSHAPPSPWLERRGGVRMGGSAGTEAVPCPLCMRKGGKRTGARAQTWRQCPTPSLLCAQRGHTNGRAQEQEGGMRGHTE